MKKLRHLVVVLCINCGPQGDFMPPSRSCEDFEGEAIRISELEGMFENSIVQIQEDLYLDAYVVSSDAEGNVFGAVYLQDDFEEDSPGIVLRTDLFDTYLFFPFGARIQLRLKGLYLGKTGDMYSLGARTINFGNPSISRLPALKTKNIIRVSCQDIIEPTPKIKTLDALSTKDLGTLVELKNLELAFRDTVLTFADKAEETPRSLIDCQGLRIEILNSGYSEFYSDTIPESNGWVRGILIQNRGDFALRLNSRADLRFDEPDCDSRIIRQSSPDILISEIADPNNEVEARFIELYNSGSSAVELNDWKLKRYTNANLEAGSTVDLSGMVIEAGKALVLSAFPEGFLNTYGFTPDLIVASNGPADSNGDDNIVLLDPFDQVMDIFGVIGEDGSGTAHEFEDGKAVRRPEIKKNNAVFLSSEWMIFNDTGASGTTNQPQNAPQDFGPGIHQINN